MMLAGPPSRKGMGADHDDEAHRPESRRSSHPHGRELESVQQRLGDLR